MYSENSGDDSMQNGMKVLWGLVIVNVLMYLFIAPPDSETYRELALKCWCGDFKVYQLMTAGFLHGGFSHIFFNMYGLYLFGKLVVRHLNGREFLWLYIVGVLCGNLLFLGIYWQRSAPLVGASGAVCAVMMAAAMLEPERRFTVLFMPFDPIKTSTLVVCYTIIEVVLALGGPNSGIAHLAHLGGFVGGYLLVKFLRRGNVAWDPFRSKRIINWKGPVTGETDATYANDGAPVSQRELDALLDKISRYGINSLSPDELARLKQAREEMRR
jgi:membrane associated rhomboid family serine protease